MEPAEINEKSRNVVVTSKGEQIGLLVDQIADVVMVPADQIEPSPPNVNGVDGSFFKGVYKLESELLVILDIEEALAGESVTR
jgi:purine-binding chemotaxis protein CheW